MVDRRQEQPSPLMPEAGQDLAISPYRELHRLAAAKMRLERFGGITFEEIAEHLDVSARIMARAWLRRGLSS